MSVTGAIIAGVGAASSIGAAAIGSSAAGHAADTQAAAADRAAQLSHEDSMASLDYQKQKDAEAAARAQPWLDAGKGALGQIQSDMANGVYHDWTGKFNAPDSVTEQNDPGFQFRLAEGQKALERSAAAKGGLTTGGTLKALTQYGQNFGSNEYSHVYDSAFQQYQQGYNEFNNNQTSRFNRFASISGLGQQTTAQQTSASRPAVGNQREQHPEHGREQPEHADQQCSGGKGIRLHRFRVTPGV
jgi:hypothetical protein